MSRASVRGAAPSAPPVPEALAAPLRRLARSQRLLRLAGAVGLWALVCGLGLAAQVALLQVLPGHAPAAAPQVALALLLLLAAAAAAILPPLPPQRLARLVERRFPDLHDGLLAAIDPAPGAAGSPLHMALVSRVTARLAPERLGSALDRRPAARALGAGLAGMVVAAAALLVCPAGVARMLGQAETPPPTPAAAADRLPEPAPVGPALYDLRVTVAPPSYTGLPTRQVSAELDGLRVPVGSALTIEARQGAGCRTEATVTPRTGELAPLTGEALSLTLVVKGALRWSLCTTRDGRHLTAGPYRVAPIPDTAPRVTLERPGRNLSLAAPEPVELAVRASDDYGLAEVNLEYRRAGAGAWQSLALGGGDREMDARWQWDLASMGLQAGDVLQYRAMARDNNAATGATVSRTRVYEVRIAPPPAPARRPTEVRAAQAAEAQSLEALRQEADALRRDLREAAQAGAEGGAAAQETARSQLRDAGQRLEQSAQQVREAMDQADQVLRDSPLMSPETLAKVMEVHRLMGELVNRDMADLTRQIQEALSHLGQSDADRRLASTLEAQQRFVEKLDRTLALLRRARQEAQLEALKRAAEGLARRQEGLVSTSGDDQEARARSAAQSRLAEEARGLPEQIRKLADESGTEAGVRSGLGEVASQLQNADPAARMRQAASALSRGRSQEARGPQQQAAGALRQAADQLGSLQSQAAAQARAGLERELRRVARDSLALSAAQEGLNQSSLQAGNVGRGDQTARQSVLRNLRRRQDALESGTRAAADSLRKLADTTPLVTPELVSQADTTAAEMAAAGRSLSGGDMLEGCAQQGTALTGLNELAADLLEASRKAGTMTARAELQEHLQRLEELTRRQEALNSQLGQGAPGGQGQGGSGSRPGGTVPDLSALAQEQAMVREALQKLMGGSSGSALAQRLGGVPAEMSRSEDEMRGRQVSPQTVQRQGTILRKMLDAQRSLYSRPEPSRERKAEAAKAYRKPLAPPALQPQRPRASSVVPRSADSGGGLPLDYEDLTRRYLDRVRR